MASSGLVVETFAEVSGWAPSTLLRMVRTLRAANLVPVGEPGRGQHRGQYEPEHLSAVIFAFAGDQPSDAAMAASALSSMRYLPSQPDGALPAIGVGGTLGDAVVGYIREAARFMEAGARGETLNTAPAIPAFISFSLSLPRRAWVRWRSPVHGPPRDDVYIPPGPYSSKSVVMSEKTISHHLIWTAGGLWLDTQARRAGDAAMLDFLKRRRTEDAPQ